MVRHKLHVLNCAGKAAAVVERWKKLGEPLPIFYARAARA
jgi:hypothetical protein